MEKFLDFMKLADGFLPPLIEALFLAVTPLLVGLLARAMSDKKRLILADVARGVFESVESLAKRTEMTSDDKFAEGMKKFAEELGKTPSKKEEDIAKQTFERLAAATKEKLQ